METVESGCNSGGACFGNSLSFARMLQQRGIQQRRWLIIRDSLCIQTTRKVSSKEEVSSLELLPCFSLVGKRLIFDRSELGWSTVSQDEARDVTSSKQYLRICIKSDGPRPAMW